MATMSLNKKDILHLAYMERWGSYNISSGALDISEVISEDHKKGGEEGGGKDPGSGRDLGRGKPHGMLSASALRRTQAEGHDRDGHDLQSVPAHRG